MHATMVRGQEVNPTAGWTILAAPLAYSETGMFAYCLNKQDVMFPINHSRAILSGS